MPKFFVNKTCFEGNRVRVMGENARHIAVLRMKSGEPVLLCDGEGFDYRCVIERMSKEEIWAEVVEQIPNKTEPALKITLFQGLPKSDKLEWIIQKTVELGVVEIVPVVTEFSVARITEKQEKKTERWQKIAEAAAMQSERGIIPHVGATILLRDALQRMQTLDIAYVAHERDSEHTAQAQFVKSAGKQTAGILIGPEGGFSPAEIELCLSAGIQPVSLGKRILRTETAGLAAVLLLLFVNENEQSTTSSGIDRRG